MTKEMGKGDRERERLGSRGSVSSNSRKEGSSSSSRDRDRDRDRHLSRLSSKDDHHKRLRNEPSDHKSSSSSSSKGDSSSSKVFSSGSPSRTSTTTAAPPPSSSLVASEPKEEIVPLISTMSKKELFDLIVDNENAVAKCLLVSETMAQGKSLCNELETNYQELRAMIATPPEDPDEYEEKMEDGLLKISSLRQINRMMKLKMKSVKDEQLNVRNAVDADHLLLQNLLYEATHLQNQVSAVQDYKGMDEAIELIPIEQFYEQAPEKISKQSITQTDSHLLRIARLEFEFVQRQKLTEDCNSLEKDKEAASKSIDETQSKLDSIGPLLNAVLEATKPVQQYFGIDISSKKEQNQIAQYLPPELYVLLVQSNAFKEARGGKADLVIHLRGNLEEAKELVVTPDDVEEDSDSDKDQDPEAEISRRRLMRKKSSIYTSPEDFKKKLVQRHPLWIEWVVHAKGTNAVFIQFFYLLKLKIVTVKSKTIEDAKKLPEGELVSSGSLLEELFPDDTGMESPNPANGYMFQKVDAKGISDFVSETGKPYLWAQKLAGVDFPYPIDFKEYDDAVFRPRMETSALNIEKVLRAITMRLSNQTTLSNQLKLLETRHIQIPLPAKELFPPKISTAFKSWEEISFKDFSGHSFAKEYLKTDFVSNKGMFFKAILERGRAAMVALVSISSNFPFTPPVFCLQLEKDGEKRNSTNDATIRDLESEINIYSLDEFQPWSEILVSLQLMRLLQGTDIILETDFIVGESAGPSEFAREKLFLRAASGRNLRRPFKYCGTGGGYFSQRY